jgi:2-O-methyltransferase
MTETEYARQIVASTASPVVLELGAHHGHDTIPIWRAMRRRGGRYIAVEADPENCSILRDNVRETSVQVIHAAIVGDPEVKTVEFHRSHGGSGSGSIRHPKDHLNHFPEITFRENVTVPAVTLDALAFGIERIELIWADLQGAERDMITGGRDALRRTHWLMIEAERIEMYDGQATRDQLLAMLPDCWKPVQDWSDNANVLLRNSQCD